VWSAKAKSMKIRKGSWGETKDYVGADARGGLRGKEKKPKGKLTRKPNASMTRTNPGPARVVKGRE